MRKCAQTLAKELSDAPYTEPVESTTTSPNIRGFFTITSVRLDKATGPGGSLRNLMFQRSQRHQNPCQRPGSPESKLGSQRQASLAGGTGGRTSGGGGR